MYVNPKELDAARLEANRVRAGLPIEEITNFFPVDMPERRAGFEKYVAYLAAPETEEQRKFRLASIEPKTS